MFGEDLRKTRQVGRGKVDSRLGVCCPSIMEMGPYGRVEPEGVECPTSRNTRAVVPSAQARLAGMTALLSLCFIPPATPLYLGRSDALTRTAPAKTAA